ncbi:FAD-binding oxidoreductase [Nonomuraea sp. KC401]|uniref:NAD(P)/FAD-dependent oxidoreductase n=1 Tax=unclassified Nonomuraea TaxID=2593643 RepID=UPI0010FEF13B|nr:MULTISPECIES: FAD-dependent oxidoreductase [unclassified Nonomuraea]NBE92270.1 FAD-dependent oxidoreductase [Nonomuraea sp. K271]TLF77210.1 FAD-binding oxidoreductase [Nonomuraea sp. KC401]
MVTITADVVVVGAGVIGSSTALELARAGFRVVVVDRLGGPGQGSTSASSAVVRFNYSTFPGVAAAWEARHCWESWPDHLGFVDQAGMARFWRTGMVFLDVDVAPKERVVPLFDRAGIPYETWDASLLAERIPGLDVGRFWPPKRLDDDGFWADPTEQLGALWTPDAGWVDDPTLAAVNLADAAGHAGARFVYDSQVTAVRRTGGRVAGVALANGEQVDAPIVVNAAGPWSSAFNQMAGVGDDFAITTRPMRQEVHFVTAPPNFNHGDRPGPVIADLDLGTYLRGAPGNGLYVGGTEPECDPMQWLDDPDEANLRPTVALFDAQVTRAARRFPNLSVPARPSGIAGVYDVSTDWTPLYDRTSLDGFYVAIGTSGNQFKNAPVAGRFMAAIVAAVENGHDHDSHPVQYRGEHTGLTVDLGAFSRRRTVNADSTGTVIG